VIFTVNSNIASYNNIIVSCNVHCKLDFKKKNKIGVPFMSSHTAVNESLTIVVGNYSVTAFGEVPAAAATAAGGAHSGEGTSFFLVYLWGQIIYLVFAIFVVS
jgi:hypothetical protein